MMGVCEALLYAYRAGLDLETVLASVSGGAAGSWSLSNLAPRAIAGNMAPGFYVEHFVKDMASRCAKPVACICHCRGSRSPISSTWPCKPRRRSRRNPIAHSSAGSLSGINWDQR